MNNQRQSNQDNWPERLQADASEREQAIGELRAYLVRGLTQSLRHRYGGKIQVDDVVQVAILKILASINSFRSQSKFTTWAMSIAVRVGISELRRVHYRDVSLDLISGDDSIRIDVTDERQDSVENQVNREQILRLLEKLIDETLSDKQRLAIRGTLEGLPIECIADRLSSNRNAVYKLVHDARLRLRMGFEASGVTADEIASILT